MIRLIFILFFIPFLNCYSQEFSKVSVENWIFKKVQPPAQAYVIGDNVFKDGGDHTALLQQLLNKYSIVVLPSKQININYQGVSLRSNTQLFFQQNSVLKMIANNKGSYAILRLREVNNVKIYNAQLVGDRELHKGTDGEWGMGIDIRSSKNISIYNPFVKNMWGDGIYLGIQKQTSVNENILIESGIIDYSRRNGISITSGKNIRLISVSVYNTFGTNPMAAIDIEPNKNSVMLSGIILDNIKTINSGFSGLTIALSHLRFTKYNVSNITIKNHYDRGSVHALRIGPVSAPKAGGNIQIEGANWGNNSNSAFIFSDITKTSLKVNVKNSYLNNVFISNEIAEKNVKGTFNKAIRKNFVFN